MGDVSQHFAMWEFTLSDVAVRHGIDNSIPDVFRPNVMALAKMILEPAREALGPIRINSGYRCPALNRLVKGSPNSQHLKGQAADIHPLAVSLKELARYLQVHAPFDQLILEFSSWVHVSYALEERGQILVSSLDSSGHPQYRDARADEFKA